MECEGIPSILFNLRRELESQLSAAAGDAFHGPGEARSLAALGAFTESLQVKPSKTEECPELATLVLSLSLSLPLSLSVGSNTPSSTQTPVPSFLFFGYPCRRQLLYRHMFFAASIGGEPASRC